MKKPVCTNMVIAQSGGPSMVINQSLVGAVLAARAARTDIRPHGAVPALHKQAVFTARFLNFSVKFFQYVFFTLQPRSIEFLCSVNIASYANSTAVIYPFKAFCSLSERKE